MLFNIDSALLNTYKKQESYDGLTEDLLKHFVGFCKI